jgi:integrase
MQGSIQKKGNTYYVVLPINGKRKWIKGGSTKRDAQRVLNEKLQELNTGTYKEIPKILFKDFVKTWIDTYGLNLKESTKENYESQISCLLSVLGNHKLQDINLIVIQNYMKKQSGEISAGTLRNHIMRLKELLNHAYQWGYLKNNPVTFLKNPKYSKPEIDILTPQEIDLLIANISKHYRVALLTSVLTGLRAGELWALQWKNIDWNSKQIHIKQTLFKNKLTVPKTPNAIRKIDVPDSLLFELKKWKIACPTSEFDLVFPTQEGVPVNHSSFVTTIYASALRRAGLRHVNMHSLRHSNASMRIHAGQNPKYISKQLGHSSIKITFDTYGHLFDDSDFNRKQVDLFMQDFNSVRKPLENSSVCVVNT